MTRDAKIAMYTIFGTLVAFKVVTAVAVLLMQPTVEAAAFLTLVNGVWFALVAVPIGLFCIFWYRRLRARAKRRQLIEAEWSVSAPASARR